MLRLRGAFDPKRFYKSFDQTKFPKYFQFGTVVEGPTEYLTDRRARSWAAPDPCPLAWRKWESRIKGTPRCNRSATAFDGQFCEIELSYALRRSHYPLRWPAPH